MKNEEKRRSCTDLHDFNNNRDDMNMTIEFDIKTKLCSNQSTWQLFRLSKTTFTASGLYLLAGKAAAKAA